MFLQHPAIRLQLSGSGVSARASLREFDHSNLAYKIQGCILYVVVFFLVPSIYILV